MMTYIRLVLACHILLLLCSCGSDATGVALPVLPHDPVDAAWKAVENLEYAYNTQDIDLVVATLDSDFMHHLDEEDWADYDGDGIIDTYWGPDLEEEFTEGMFDAADLVEMTLTGEDEWPWSGDSTGQSMELPRTFDLKVYCYVGGQYEGSQISGTAIFVCRPDLDDEWRIWQLFLQPSVWWPPES
jgi:hypothetical protein